MGKSRMAEVKLRFGKGDSKGKYKSDGKGKDGGKHSAGKGNEKGKQKGDGKARTMEKERKRSSRKTSAIGADRQVAMGAMQAQMGIEALQVAALRKGLL